MIWDFLRKKSLEDAGELARRQHSQWLTDALETGKDVPRIPLRRVDQGGFSRHMERKTGPGRAEQWWRLALEQTPGTTAE